ncbi:hypothetical protein VTK73DRAFT_9093 [Phialemonium thermophilum]|uniref:Calponin-homology (CH) domain-containing protein n=1 Tax=Phialemonium thermophilum TaxID=223376 RepID=A0ABR3XLK0_9PEZI
MPLTKAAQSALLKWVNTFDGLDRKAETLDDLTDGIILAQVLHILDPDFSPSSLNQNPKSWPEKKRNLEIVYRSLAQFLRHETPYPALSPNEFRNIVENPDANGICELLSAFVSAACLGNLAPIHVPTIMKMDRPDQREIMAIIQRKQSLMEDAARQAELNGGNLDDLPVPTDDFEDEYAVQPPRDPELAVEEEISRLRRDLDMVKKQNADLLSRNEQLRVSREEVVQDLQIAQKELDVLQRTSGTDAAAVIRRLEREKREEELLIDNLQAQAEDDRVQMEKLRNELEHVRSKSGHVKELEDRVKELEHEGETLRSKLKQAEWYKKSAEQAKITEQKNRELESQNHELREQARNLDKLRTENEMLHQTCQQYRKQVGTYESEKFEDQAMRAHLKQETETLALEKQILADQLRIAEDQIRDLQERMQISMPQVPASPVSGPPSNLEQELESTTEPTIKFKLEISRLEAENKLLRGNMGVAAENERLRREIEFEKQKYKTLEDKYADTYSKYVLASEQNKAIVENLKDKGDELFKHTKTRLDEALAELQNQRAKIRQLEADLADRERDLLASKADLAAVGKQSIDALEVLKSSDQLISASLRSELDSTREKIRILEIDLEQNRQQLTNALISKDRLRQQLDDAGITGMPQPKQDPGTPAPAPQEAETTKSRKEDLEKIEKLKTALKQKVQQLEKLELDKYELQRRLKAAEGGSALAAHKAATDQIIKNLQRENALIATAWYDITSRLQSNHVVLQRRHDVPKSWLNRQRQMVNTTPRR